MGPRTKFHCWETVVSQVVFPRWFQTTYGEGLGFVFFAARFSSFLSPESHAQRSCLSSSHRPGPLHTWDTAPAPALSLSSSRTCCSTPSSQRFHGHQPALHLSCCLTALHLSQLTFPLQAACSLKARNVLNSLDPQHPATSWSLTNMSVR